MRFVLFLLVVGCGTHTPDDKTKEDSCEIDGPDGFGEGELVANFEVLRCDGTTVRLRELVACKKLTLLDVGAAAYRKCREATTEYATDPVFDDLQARGLNIVQVFFQDESFAVPTLDFCARYSADHQVDFDFLVDQIGETQLFSQVAPMNMVVDADGVILHKWTGQLPDDRIQILESLLP